MVEWIDGLREPSLASVVLRGLLAVLCGGIIGLEREYKRRPAGFRTHILICLGAAVTTMTSQYLYLVMQFPTDAARLGAQVISGIGFIGAGTIIVTRRQRVKGLTTAAGLWVSAIVGLSLGSGFYEGALLATAFVLIAELVFSRLEYRILQSAPEISLYIEYQGSAALSDALALFRSMQAKVETMEVTRRPAEDKARACVLFSLRLTGRGDSASLLARLGETAGILLVEEL